MASIRMTSHLRAVIIQSGHKLFLSAIQKAEKKLDETFYDRLGQEMHDSLYAARDISMFPEDWKKEMDGISVNIVSHEQDGQYAITKTINSRLKALNIGNHFASSFLYMPQFYCSNELFNEYYKYKEFIKKTHYTVALAIVKARNSVNNFAELDAEAKKK